MKYVQTGIIRIAMLCLFTCILQTTSVAQESVEQLRQVEAKIQKAVSLAMPAVVAVTDGHGFGSGVIVSEDGLVLTAGHVMSSPFKGKYEVIFPDGRRVRAEPLGKNLNVDAGMVRITQPGPYPFAKVAGDDARIGDWVITLGHSGGYDLGRKPPVRTGRILKEKDHQLISDAVLIGGDSGGPLFNIEGEVIGIHSSIGDSIAENRHVRINTFRQHWTRMAQGDVWGRLPNLSEPKKKTRRARIGVIVDRTAVNALVKSVHEGSPAYKAGIRGGDVITRFDNTAVGDAQDLIDMVKTKRPGQSFMVEIQRNGLYFSAFIVLKFEKPSLRNRPVQPYERQSRSLRRQLPSSVNEVRQSTVKITDGVEQIALGTVVRADGMIVTKASELDSKNKIYCHLGASKLYEATVLSRDDVNDVALLKIPRNDLKPVKWASKQPRNGSFVLTPNQVGEVVALGSYSVVARSTVGENQGFLGAAPQNATDGVQIAEPPEPDTAAYAAGLRKGDVIMQIDDTAVFEVQQLVYAIQQRQAGDKVSVKFKRQGLVMSATVKLAGRSLPPERAARFKMMSRLGAVPSDRKSEFPVVFQHDSPLFPEQCGGPICDLDGNVLGINIARETRASSFAIPSIHIQKVLDNLFRFDIAARDNQSR